MSQIYNDITKDLPPDLQLQLLVHAARVREAWRVGGVLNDSDGLVFERIQKILARGDNTYTPQAAFAASEEYADTLKQIGAQFADAEFRRQKIDWEPR